MSLTNSIYQEYESFTSIIQKYIIAGILRENVIKLPPLPIEKMESKEEFERSMLLLSIIAHSYLHGNSYLNEEPLNILPSNIAIPWYNVSKLLGKNPALSHSSIVLNNWTYFDDSKPFGLDNIRMINGILGGIDEDWFYLIAADIEKKAAIGIHSIFHLIKSINNSNVESAKKHLKIMTESVSEMTKSLEKMRIHNSPFIFYNRVRNYLSGWEKGSEKFPKGVIFEGVSEEPFHVLGATAAQSSILHVYDELFNIKHQSNLLKEMREYMPKEHRSFIEDVSKWASNLVLYTFVNNSKDKELIQQYNDCIEQVLGFRTKHIQIVTSYIINQSSNTSKEKGTGGSSLIPWLKQLREEAQEKQIKL